MNWKKIAMWAVALIVLVIVGKMLYQKFGAPKSTASVTGPTMAAGGK